MLSYFFYFRKFYDFLEYKTMDKQNPQLSNLIDIVKSNITKKKLAKKIIEKNISIAPLVSKLITDDTIRPTNHINVNRYILETIHNRLKSIKENNKSIIKLFPDIELGIQILISSILSPKKMTKTEIHYRIDDTLNLPPEISSQLLEKIENYIIDNYDIDENMLSKILRETLFESGSYSILIVPENSLDEIINKDMILSIGKETFKEKIEYAIEAYTKPLNILYIDEKENQDKKDLKNPFNIIDNLANETVHITDNPNVIKISRIKENLRKNLISKVLKSGLQTSITQENFKDLEYIDIFRKRNKAEYNNLLEIKTKEEAYRRPIGKPLFIKLPSESVIPVFIGNEKEKHVGYFILLDEEGRFIDISINEGYVDSINRYMLQSTYTQITPTQKAFQNLLLNTESNITIKELLDVYKQIIEQKLYKSIKRSIYGHNVNLNIQNEVYYIMFLRALKNEKTSILYVPKELLAYFAFYYNDMGMGVSLLEKMSILSSLRAIVLFAKIMAYAKQSIDITKVNVQLDPNDPDPMKTIEQIQDLVMRLRQNFFPLGINNPVDLVNWIQRAGLQFTYENNPLLPNVKIDFENATLQHTIPPSELEEELKKMMILSMGLPPEMVDTALSPEFATVAINNNILLTKRVLVLQSKFLKDLNNLIRIIFNNDMELRKQVKNIVSEKIDDFSKSLVKDEDKEILALKNEQEKIDYIVDKVLDSVYIDLPKPELTNLNNLGSEFESYKENLDKVLDSYFSEEILNENTLKEGHELVSTIKALIRHYFLRKWSSENGYMAELNDITKFIDSNDKNNKVFENIENYINQAFKFLLNFKNMTDSSNSYTTSDISKDTYDETEEGSTDLEKESDQEEKS